MCCLASYLKSFRFRRSAQSPGTLFPPGLPFNFVLSTLNVLFALPYKIRLSPLSTAFTHFDRGGRVPGPDSLPTAHRSLPTLFRPFFSATYELPFSQPLCFQKHLRCPLFFSSALIPIPTGGPSLAAEASASDTEVSVLVGNFCACRREMKNKAERAIGSGHDAEVPYGSAGYRRQRATRPLRARYRKARYSQRKRRPRGDEHLGAG